MPPIHLIFANIKRTDFKSRPKRHIIGKKSSLEDNVKGFGCLSDEMNLEGIKGDSETQNGEEDDEEDRSNSCNAQRLHNELMM